MGNELPTLRSQCQIMAMVTPCEADPVKTVRMLREARRAAKREPKQINHRMGTAHRHVWGDINSTALDD